jgi:hypothetical protein
MHESCKNNPICWARTGGAAARAAPPGLCKNTITSEGVAQLAFREVFRTFGMPLVLISDRDPRFTAKFWQTFFSLSGTHLNMSSAHHPRTYGQTERTHRTLEEMLRHFVHDRQ